MPYVGYAKGSKRLPQAGGMRKRGRGYVRTSHAQYAGFAPVYRQLGFAADAGGELKFHDLDVDDTVVSTGGTIAEDSCLTIVQGDGESERIGRKVTVKKVNWRYTVKAIAQTNTAIGNDTCRVILYVDKQTNGLTAAVLDILETADYQSYRNLSNKGRFVILMDRTHDVNTVAASGQSASDETSAANYSFTFNKALNLPIEYDNTAGTGAITTMRSNNIGVLTISDAGRCLFDSKMRIRFVG